MQMNLLNIQPSQFYISEEKLRDVYGWLAENDSFAYEPIPVKELNGNIVFTDGHTRAYALYQLGFHEINIIWDTDELNWDAYQKCVDACNVRNVYNIADLDGRVIDSKNYILLWDNWCDEMQANLEK